jgi:hypothetical protein
MGVYQTGCLEVPESRKTGMPEARLAKATLKWDGRAHVLSQIL